MIQETHLSELDANFWTNQWGDQIIFSHGSNKSAGVAICFNKFPGDIITYRSDTEGHWLIAVLKIKSHFLILVNVYGHRTTTQNKHMLDTITKIVSEFKTLHPTDLVLMGGDWNIAPDKWEDRWPSKFDSHHYNPTIEEFNGDNSLIEVWRHLHPNNKQYSWYKPNGKSKSRIDYWLSTVEILNSVSESTISKAPLTDHCMIEIRINSADKKRGNKGYWKFNSNLITNKEYCSKVKEILTEIENSDTIDYFYKKWEFAKFRIREMSFKFSKEMLKEKQKEETNLFQEISQYCSKVELNNEEKGKLMALQNKLDDLYFKKAQGAFIRLKAKWIEDGEKNSSYFSNLEKRRRENKAITSLLIDEVESNNQKIIEKEVCLFYSKLYSSEYSIVELNNFFLKKSKTPSLKLIQLLMKYVKHI